MDFKRLLQILFNSYLNIIKYQFLVNSAMICFKFFYLRNLVNNLCFADYFHILNIW